MVTLLDASRTCAVSYTTLNRWVKKGKLQVRRLGGYRIVDPGEVQKLVEEMRRHYPIVA
jgi:predicted site-specific integrase-resolvase